MNKLILRPGEAVKVRDPKTCWQRCGGTIVDVWPEHEHPEESIVGVVFPRRGFVREENAFKAKDLLPFETDNDMTKNEFKQGDIVRLKPKDQLPDWLKNSSGQIAEVAAYFPDEDRYSMKFGNKYYTMKGEYFELCPSEVYLAQRRTAFLAELQELLRKYDARIDCQYHEYAQSDYPCVIFKDEEPLFWIGDNGITPDNIMDFDKE